MVNWSFLLLLFLCLLSTTIQAMRASQHVTGSDMFMSTVIGATGLAKGGTVKVGE